MHVASKNELDCGNTIAIKNCCVPQSENVAFSHFSFPVLKKLSCVVKCAVGTGGREAVVAERRRWLGPSHFDILPYCCHRTRLQAQHSSISRSAALVQLWHRSGSMMVSEPPLSMPLHPTKSMAPWQRRGFENG